MCGRGAGTCSSAATVLVLVPSQLETTTHSPQSVPVVYSTVHTVPLLVALRARPTSNSCQRPSQKLFRDASSH